MIQVAENGLQEFLDLCDSAGLSDSVRDLGRPAPGDKMKLICDGKVILDESLPELQKIWSEASHAIQRLRDNPDCADQELDSLADWSRTGISPRLTFDPSENPATPMISSGARPPVAILREQ